MSSNLNQRIANLSPEKRALLARRLRQKKAATNKMQAITPRADQSDYPLSYAQQRLWFLDQFEPNSPFYNISAALRLTGPLDTAALQKTLQTIGQRHEVLRVNFQTENGYPAQVVAPELAVPLPVTDLRGLPPAEREKAAAELAAVEAQKPFDLSRDPLLRASLLQLDEEEYVFFLTMHHIVSDGWSVGVFIRETAVLYDAFVNGRDNPLPPLTIQYSDYADWQRRRLESGVRAEQLAYWQEKLGDAPPVLELPADHPRPAVQSHNGTHYKFALPPDLADALRQLGQAEEATLFMTLLAAFHTLLYRYTGQESINVGAPVANRTHVEMEQLIGFFVNTLVVNGRFPENVTFRQLLRQLRQTVLDAFAHQDVPFEMLVETLQTERDMSHTPLFQVMFDLQKAPPETFRLGDLQARLLETEPGTAKFDLLLMVLEREDGLEAVFEYNTDLFEPATIQRMAGHFQTLLEGIAADPDQPVATLPLLTEGELRQILLEWNDTARPYPQDKTFAELFAAQAARTPERTAVFYEGRSLTYDQLNRRANQLAHRLQKLGAKPGDLVGLAVDRSLEMLVGIVGILKSGAAYLPLDPTYPRGRLAFMLADAQARLLVTQTEQLAALPADDLTVVCLDGDAAALAQEPETNPDNAAAPEDTAYVIYTSGSTGRPKGVMIPHRAMLHLAAALHQVVYDGRIPDDEYRISLNAPISFDASVQQLVMLLHGCTLHVIPHEARQDGAALLAYIRTHRLHALDCVPSQLKLLLAAGLLEGDGWTLEKALPGGEAIDEATWRQLQNAPRTQFYNMYGPTECAVDAIVAPVKTAGPRPVIGRPVPNNQIYLLDQNRQPVPIGVPGEIYIGGAGVGKGYLHRPELTAERFVQLPNYPITQLPITVYRTGDLARYLPNGNIEFLGRVDHQVKVRGFRIELGEIEANLREHTAVREAVVIVREDTPGNQRLAAYVVAEGEETLTISALRHFLQDRLPEYMIPALFIFLDALPLTPNGKVDRRALPAPEQTRPDLDKPYVPPRTEVERYLANLWQEVLGIDRIGVHDNFFELGGNSIQAAVATNRFQEELETEAHVRAIFLAPTVAELAAYMAEYYPEAAAKIDQTAVSPSLPAKISAELATAVAEPKLTAVKIKQMWQIITAAPPAPRAEIVPPDKNPTAVFILSPPRSGSTLLRTMLAGHPRLFAPPELELLSFNTLAERKAALTGDLVLWREGVIRAIMEIEQCDADAAEQIMQSCENEGLTVKQFYRRLQEKIGGQMLVDKTPTYALNPRILQRMETDFADTRYIHLLRHPYATIYSFMEAKLDEIFFRQAHDFTRRELAELFWLISQQNIREFLQNVPPERQIQIRYEDLVTQPQAVMETLCQFLEVDFDPALLQPYDGRRMTDGIRPGAQMAGDFKFYLRRKIDPATATRWRSYHTVNFLCETSARLAQAFAYELSAAASPPLTPLPDGAPRPLSFAQQRLWFLDQLEPDSPFYNIPAAVRLSGPLQLTAVQQSLNEIVRRHEVLRANFQTIEGKAALTITPARPIPLPVIDLTDLPPEGQETEVQRRATATAQRPFNLAEGPLLRAVILKLSETEHVFLLTMHHIISDGWSVGVFIQEMAALYEAFTQRRPSPLPDLPIQYSDYAAWQRQWLQGERLEEQLAYWKEQLAGIPPLLELPTDRPRPSVQTFDGAIHWFHLPPKLTDALKSLSQQESVTLYATLLAVFQTLLYRYTAQDDICVGTPIAGRSRAELEKLIGFFVNTLVMRGDLSGKPTFRELLARVQETTIAAYSHQDIPFEMLVDELAPQREMSHTPLFQVVFTLQNAPVQPKQLPELTMTPIPAESGTAKFDLTLALTDTDSGLQGALEYNTALFDESTIARMAGHFQRLLEGIVADPDQSVATLPLLTEAELRQILVEWNETTAVYPHDQCIHQLFTAQAERTPQATAVSHEYATQLTYAELNRRANQVAHRLRRHGVGPDTFVGLCVERSPEMIIGIMGILKAGGAYLPLDPAYPPERLAFMIADAQPAVILTGSHTAETVMSRVVELSNSQTINSTNGSATRLPDHKTIRLNSVTQEPDHNPASNTTPDNLAYIIYTSGSTGKPKGVLLKHRGVANLITAYAKDFDIGPGSRILQFFSFSFDGSVLDIFSALLTGATLITANRETMLPGPDLAKLIDTQGVTLALLPPAALAALPPGRYSTLQTIISGGEACTREIVDRWAPGRRFVNAYGPTEITVAATWHVVENLTPQTSNIPIGRPIANTQLYILDKHRQPVPPGVPGELYISGDGLARGYLNRPELTAEKFTQLPNYPITNYQLPITAYRTGDRCRYLPDGTVEFLERVDHQVKVRGFRIELGEIEAVLAEHPDVRQAIAIVREDTPGDKRLVAYVLPERDTAVSPPNLRQFLSQTLPAYMIPAAFVTLDELPLTPNGKINRRALPAPDHARPEIAADFVAPRTPQEEELADIWAQLLGLDQVGIHDNFFELGGDSILSIQVIARAKQAGIHLTPKQLFQHPTIAELAAVAGSGPVIQAEQGIVTGDVPLTPIQHWFFAQDFPQPHHWNQAMLLEVTADLNPALLETAVSHLLSHHDALRLRFHRDGDGWRQTNAAPDNEIPFGHIDLSDLPAGQRLDALQAQAAFLQTSLDLAYGPLLRVAYFTMGNDQPDYLLFIIHHLAVDSISWRILLEDFQNAYLQLAQGGDAHFPPKSSSFQQWAQRLIQYAQTDTVTTELPFWQQIARQPIRPLPVDFPNRAADNSEASARSLTVSLAQKETQALLQDVPATYGTEINDVLLTALAQALARWTGSPGLLLHLEGHGREDILEAIDISRTVGWFTTLFPVWLNAGSGDEPGEALKSVKEQLRRIPQRGIGYGLLRYLHEDTAVRQQMAALPDPQIGFNYLGQFDSLTDEGAVFAPSRASIGAPRSMAGQRAHLLDVNGGIAGGQLQLEWTYSANCHRRDTIEKVAEDFINALRGLIAHCQSADAGGYTPSDFPDVALDDDEIDALMLELGQAD